MILLLRHAWAGDRALWEGDDAERPLDERGRGQAERLAARLEQFDVARIVSSPYRRCVETVEPLAATLGLPIEVREELAEHSSAERAAVFVRSLTPAEASTVVCGHGGLEVAVLGHLPEKRWKKASTLLLDDGLHPAGRLKPPG